MRMYKGGRLICTLIIEGEEAKKKDEERRAKRDPDFMTWA
jgi:hypothetical protein